jgi:multiple sugar transport system substrate-binding protein
MGHSWAVESIAVLAKHIDRYIWPGTMPSAVENNMKIALEDIFYNGADIATALKSAEDTCNQELEGSNFVPAEPQYKYAAEAK